MSKGSHKRKPDPRYCTPEELEKRWDEAFGKKNPLYEIDLSQIEMVPKQVHAEITGITSNKEQP